MTVIDPNDPNMPKPKVKPPKPGMVNSSGPGNGNALPRMISPGGPRNLPPGRPVLKPVPGMVSSHGPGSGAPPTARPLPRMVTPPGRPNLPPRIPPKPLPKPPMKPPVARPVPGRPITPPGAPNLPPSGGATTTLPGPTNLPPQGTVGGIDPGMIPGPDGGAPLPDFTGGPMPFEGPGQYGPGTGFDPYGTGGAYEGQQRPGGQGPLFDELMRRQMAQGQGQEY